MRRVEPADELLQGGAEAVSRVRLQQFVLDGIGGGQRLARQVCFQPIERTARRLRRSRG